MILLIDNYDSFTYNLAHAMGELGAEVMVRRNDAVRVEDLDDLRPSKIVISPGPGRPETAGISMAVITRWGPSVPLLGVCLGHQAIGAAFGGRVVRAAGPVHGKTAMVEHDGRGIFRGLSAPFEAGRYHSLIVDTEAWPEDLEIAATIAGEPTVMGLRHRTFPIHGVQFHPESVLTPSGRAMLKTFLEL
ncbi:MAG TPA: aminodeoxychorismate/anthranilate synthase component II [Vicinamibacterales bacterium]|nr:aminodeoxychorismate/anthranilate synthase component II [Vicinamibacterales bacterium]